MQSPYCYVNINSLFVSKPKTINTSTPQDCNSVLINRKKKIKNPRELYCNTTPATTCQKGAAAGGNLGGKAGGLLN